MPGKWEGRFSSLKMPQGVACGNITVDRIDLKSEGYTTKATVTYTGLFRKGRSISVNVKAAGDTMSIDLDGRPITFTVKDRKENLISGSYIVGKGIDKGQFVLQPEGSPPLGDPRQCVVM